MAALARYRTVLGSAVNPVLRQGNSDRRAPASVKNYARTHPHRMGAWSPDVEDQRGPHGRRRLPLDRAVGRDGPRRDAAGGAGGRRRHGPALRPPIPVLAGEVVDAAVLRVVGAPGFLDRQIARAEDEGVLFSVHLKATMMKVSDPIIFGHVVRAFFPSTFAAYGDMLAEAGLSPNDGWGAILDGLAALPDGDAIRASFDAELAAGPALAMVDSDRGITNLHVPSDVIVDASMPAMIRTSGHMWGPDGDRGRHPRRHPRRQLRRRLPGGHRRLPGPRRLRPGHHGLGAERRADGPGRRGVRQPRQDLRDPRRRHGPGHRRRRRPSCSTCRWPPATCSACARPRTCPIRDWVKLAVTRARATGDPAVFWLDEGRAHDAKLIAKVRDLPGRPRHRRACGSRSWRPRRPPPSPSSASGGARTPSR